MQAQKTSPIIGKKVTKTEVKEELKKYPLMKKLCQVASQGNEKVMVMNKVEEYKSKVALIEGILETFPENWNRLIEAKYFQGKTTFQVAAELNIAERTVYVWENEIIKSIGNIVAMELGK